LCEAVAACVLREAAVLLFVVLPELVLVEPPVFVPLLPVLPEDAPEDAPEDPPADAGLLFVAGFFVCSVAEVEFCVCLATPPCAQTAIIPIMEATAAALRSFPQVLVTVVSLFQTT